MSTKDYANATLWGIHGGKTGDADNIFLKKNQVALGWDKMGDLGGLKDNQGRFQKGSSKKCTQIGSQVIILWRLVSFFVSSMR